MKKRYGYGSQGIRVHMRMKVGLRVDFLITCDMKPQQFLG